MTQLLRMRMDSLINDPCRWSALNPDDTPLDGYAPAPAPHVLNKAQRQEATAKGIDQIIAVEMLCDLKDLFKARSIPWLPIAWVALETAWVSGADGEDEGVEYWMSSLTYYSQIWMIKCEVQVRQCLCYVSRC